MDIHVAELQRWFRRGDDRLPDPEWHAMVSRVRGEFAEMPCMRLTSAQAGVLLGLDDHAIEAVLGCLAREGFLAQTSSGEYVRRSTAP